MLSEYQAENDTETDQQENMLPEEKASSEQEQQPEYVTIEPVTWQSEPEYDGNAAGVYVFTAVLPEFYVPVSGVSLPQITVTVREEQESSVIALLTRPYDEDNSSDMVYYLADSYDSYSWEIWNGEEWEEISEYEPELTVSKEEWYTCQVRCIVTKDDIRYTAHAEDDWQIENLGIMTLTTGTEPSGRSEYMFYDNGKRFNIKGIDNGQEIQTTFLDAGYRTASAVDGGSKVAWNSATGEAMGNSLYGSREISLVYSGRYAKIKYTVENRGSKAHSFQIGSSADVMIGNNDCAPVKGSANGLLMTGGTKNKYKFNLVAPTVDTLWYGYYAEAYNNIFHDLADRSKTYSKDSGMAWSWSGTVVPGQTWSRYVLLGVGDLPANPQVPQLTNQNPKLQEGKTTTFSGTADPGSTVCIELGGEEYSGTADANGNFSIDVIPPEHLPQGETQISYYAVSPDGGISDVTTITATMEKKPSVTLKDTTTSVTEETELDDAWYKSFISDSIGTVSYNAALVKTDVPGTYTVTYTAKKTDYADASAVLTITVLPLPLDFSGVTATRVTGKNSFTLSATLTHTGGETISETGFVWGMMQNPTISLNNGSKQTASAVKTKGVKLSVTAEEITDGVTYYARAYAKTSSGTVFYSIQNSFSINGKSYGTFTIKNNGDNTFTVTRIGGTDGAQTVYFRTVNGSAVGGTHFTHQASTLKFSQGEISQTITIAEKAVTTTFSSNAATAWSNADRTYQVEIYRVDGGGSLGTPTSAARAMTKDNGYTVDRSIYDWQTVNGPQEEKERGDYDDDERGWGQNKSYDAAKETVSIQDLLLKKTRNYWTKTAQNIYYYLTFDAKEGESGYQAVQIAPGTTLDTSAYPYQGELKGSLSCAYYMALFEHGGQGKQTNWDSHRLPRSSGNTVTKVDESHVQNDYVYFDIGQTDMLVGYGASGDGGDTWYTKSVVHHFQLYDSQEPRLLAVAPMADSTYKAGDKITVSLIFDEIVDLSNSSLSTVSLSTSWGNFTYAGGADTNVLYFTGTVPSDATERLTVNSITNAANIKDMCPTAGTASGGSGSVTVGVDNKTPVITISNKTLADKTAKATISATNATKLQYTWSQSSTMPVTGWVACAGTDAQTVTTRQTSGIWYLHVLGTYDGTGSTSYANAMFNFDNAGDLPELILSADNSTWATGRTITLTRKPTTAAVKVRIPSGTESAVSGTSYTATENGNYTFTLTTAGGETVTESITVSKIDRKAPEAVITGPDSQTQNENVILTIAPADAGGSGVSTVTGQWTKTTNGGSTITETATLEKNSDGTYSATTGGSSGNSYTYKLFVTVTDHAGNQKTGIFSQTYTVNLKVPTITLTLKSNDSKTGMTYAYTVNANGNTITAVQLPNGTATTELSGTFTLTEPGTYYVIVTDEAGHVVRSDAMTVAAGVDGTPPEVRLFQQDENWVKKATIDVSIYEKEGVASAVWKKEGDASEKALSYSNDELSVYSGTFTVTENAVYTVTVRDTNGNKGTASITVSNIDTQAPILSNGDGNHLTGSDGWWRKSSSGQAYISADYSDHANVTEIWMKVDNGEFTKKASPNQTSGTFIFSELQEGEHTYTFKAVDVVGNEATAVRTVKWDITKPEIGTITFEKKAANIFDWIIGKDSLIIHIPVSDSISGVNALTYTKTPAGGTAETVTVPLSKAAGKNTVDLTLSADWKGSITNIKCTDTAGNDSDSKSIEGAANGFIVENDLPTITITEADLTDAANPKPGNALSEGYYDENDALTLYVEVVDDGTGNEQITSGIEKITYAINDGVQNAVTGDFATALTGRYSFLIPLAGKTGDVNIKIKVSDHAGNIAEESVNVKIKGRETTPEAVPDYKKDAITGLVPGAVYKIMVPDTENESGITYECTADADGKIPFMISIDGNEIDFCGKTVAIVRKGDGTNTSDSDPQTAFPIAARPEALNPDSDIKVLPEVVQGTVYATIRIIMDPDIHVNDREYSTDGGVTWYPVPVDRIIKGLAPGTVIIRDTAKNDTPHGKEATVIIPENATTITAAFDLNYAGADPATAPAAQTGLKYTDSLSEPSDPGRAGYDFEGWYTTAACEEEDRWDFGGSSNNTAGSIIDRANYVVVNGVITVKLYAKWRENTPPNLIAELTGGKDAHSWHQELSITLTYSDNTGVKRLYVKKDNGEYEELNTGSATTNGSDTNGNTQYRLTFTDLTEGAHAYTFQAMDAAGNVKETDALTAKLDQTKPALGEASFAEGYKTLWDWIIGKKSMILHVPVTDEGSGVEQISYTMTPTDADGSPDSDGVKIKTADVRDGRAKITFSEAFRGRIAITCTDAAGNTSDTKTIGSDGGGIKGVIVEDNAPVITVLADRSTTDDTATQADGVALSEEYYNTAPKLIVTVKDDVSDGSAVTAGLASVSWKLGEGAEQSVGEDFTSTMKTAHSFVISALEGKTGTCTVTLRAVDQAGNLAERTVTVRIKASEAAPNPSIDYQKEKLTGLVAGANYRIGEETVTADAQGCIEIRDEWFGSDISICRKGLDHTLDSACVQISIEARPGYPAGITAISETIKGKQDAVLKGVDATMEYSVDGGSTWTSITDSDLTEQGMTGFAAGEILVRVKATEHTPHGDSVSITIEEGRTPPDAPIFSGDAPSTSESLNDTSEKYSIPVKNENSVMVETEIREGKADVSEITQTTLEKVVNNPDQESKIDTITIDLSGAEQDVIGVKLTKPSVEMLAKTTAQKDSGIATVTIELTDAAVILDNKTLETLAKEAKGSQIELVVAGTEQGMLNTAQQANLNEHQVAATFEAYFVSDGVRISDFQGGTAVVSVKFTPEAGKDISFYHVVYVSENGTFTRYKTKYEGGRLMFTTTHFSDYAVIYDTGEKNESVKDQTEKDSDRREDSGTTAAVDRTYRKLGLYVSHSTKTKNVLKWNAVDDADDYVIYGAPCNTKKKTNQMVKLVEIKNGKTTKWTDTNLKSGTYYKYYVKAYKQVDGKRVVLARSKAVHSVTRGGKYDNAKYIRVNKNAVTLKKGKTFVLKAKQVTFGKPIKAHERIRYESTNRRVATVNSKGVIEAKSKGTCYIFVFAQNGISKKVKVTVFPQEETDKKY